jgi:hypothetical protein
MANLLLVAATGINLGMACVQGNAVNLQAELALTARAI